MPAATGSISFLGAARYQGSWDAIGNDGTGSQLPHAASGSFSTLLVNGGYHSSTNLTASDGHYWQVWRSSTPSSNTTIDSINDWNNNDWVIYSGSQWIKLPFEDTIASIVLGDLSSGSFHLGSGNDKHVLFASGTMHSGSDNFTFDYYGGSPGNNLMLTGNFHISDDKKLYFGSQKDSYIEYDENGSDFMTMSGSSKGMALSGSRVNVVSPLTTLSGIGTAAGFGNHSTISSNAALPENYNFVLWGPITVAAGVSLTVGANCKLKIRDLDSDF